MAHFLWCPQVGLSQVWAKPEPNLIPSNGYKCWPIINWKAPLVWIKPIIHDDRSSQVEISKENEKARLWRNSSKIARSRSDIARDHEISTNLSRILDDDRRRFDLKWRIGWILGTFLARSQVLGKRPVELVQIELWRGRLIGLVESNFNTLLGSSRLQPYI